MDNTYTTEIPKDYPGIIQVNSLEEMFNALRIVDDKVNCIHWRRGALSGDFNTLANILGKYTNSDTGHYFERGLEIERYRKIVDEHCSKGELDAVQEALSQIEKDTTAFSLYPLSDSSLYCVGFGGYGGVSDEPHDDGQKWRLLAAHADPATGWIKNSDAQETWIGSGVYVHKEGVIRRRMEIGDVWLHSGLRRVKLGELGGTYVPLPPFIHYGIKPSFGEHKLLYQGSIEFN